MMQSGMVFAPGKTDSFHRRLIGNRQMNDDSCHESLAMVRAGAKSQMIDESVHQGPIQFYVKVDAVEILPDELKCYADQVNYIQHCIIVGWMLWNTHKGYTLLKAAYLRRIVNSHILKRLLLEMQRLGLIERDEYYVKGEKSYGYRFTKRYSHRPTQRVACRRPKLAQRIINRRHADFRHYKPVHKHLFEWLGRVKLDWQPALEAIQAMDFSEAKLSPDEMQELNLQLVQSIIDNHWEFTVCDYGRVHTNVTRLAKDIRQLLKIDGKPLIALDVANSQPLILYVALLKSLVGNDHPLASLGDRFCTPADGFTHNSTNPAYQGHPVATPDYYRHRIVLPRPPTIRCSFPADLQRYKELCESGALYQHLMERMQWTKDKESFKDEELFRCLYGVNGPYDSEGKYNPSRLQPVLQADFPTIWRFIRSWKKKHGYKDLACQMQKAESKLVIEGVCGRLMREHPDCPLVTIHDAILTTPEWVDEVRRTMLEEFAKIGIHPTLRVELPVVEGHRQ